MRQALSRIVLVAGTVGLGGCSLHTGPEGKATTTLHAADFSGSGERVAVVPRTTGVLDINQPSPPAPMEISGPVGESRGLGDVAARVGEPGQGAAPAVGPSVLVDAKIGEVNGKPIYASTFFDYGGPSQEPVGRRLAAKAKDLSRQQWYEEAAKQIVDRLDEIIRDELLRAEALSNLPQEKQQGLFAYIQDLQEEARRQSGGSREAFRRKLAEEDLTPEQMLKLRQQGALIYYELQQKVERRVNVTARDISQAYNGRFFDRYHHAPRYAFRIILVPADATQDRAQVEEALASGRDFAEVATLKANRYKRDDDPAKAGLEVREIKDPAKMGELFASPVLNEAAPTLAPGQTAGPLTAGSSVAWLHLDRVDGPPDEYAAQLPIEDELLRERRLVAQGRYLDRLRGRASVTSIPQMREELMRIAIERYLPPEKR